MPTFPREFQTVILPYARLFSRRVYTHVQLLLLGAILAPGKRTVTAVLRIVGLGRQPAWHKYHRVLSRVKWSARAASRLLLGQLVSTFLPAGPLVFGLDETLERRWGPRIAARGIYRDAVRSSESHLVKCSGLRWLSVCLLTPLPWAARVWALPVLTLLAPSAGWAKGQGRRHKKVTDWARQAVLQLARWLPAGCPLVRSSAWARAATPCSRSWPRPAPTPHGSRACAWTRPCTNRPRSGCRANAAGPA